MPTDQKIDYLELPADNFSKVQSFYEKTFQWKFTDFGPEYRAFTDGKLNGGFYKSKHQSQTKNGAALIVLYAANLEKTKETILANDGKIAKDIFSFPGGRRFQFFDPHENELAVWSDQ